MIISSSHRFVFVHNPKVAGSSVRKMLLPFNSSSNELWHQRYIPELQRVVDMSHLSADEFEVLRKHRYLGSDDSIPRYFRFGLVRDPYTRFFSALKEYSRQHEIDVHSSRERMEEFALSRLNSTNVRYDWTLSHFRPQHHFFFEGRRSCMDFIGRYEFLRQDLHAVFSYLNLGLSVEDLGHERDTGHRVQYGDPAEFFGDRLLRHINMLYSHDWVLLAPYFQRGMVGELPLGNHQYNVEGFRTPAGRMTFYGEPPGLSLGEKVGFLTAENERLRAKLGESVGRAT